MSAPLAPSLEHRRRGADADLVVVGAGLAGLVAARTAASSFAAVAGATRRPRIVVLDPHPPGGRGRCDEREGYVLNRGPRALYRGGTADRVLRGLGVRLEGAAPTLAGALAIVDGTGHRLPTDAPGLVRTTLLSPSEKVAVARALAAVAMAGPATGATLTVADWLDRRRLGGRPRQLLEALVRLATYVDAPDALAAAPALANVRRASLRGVRYLDGGFQSIADQLAAADADGIIEREEATVTAVQPRPDGSVVVTRSDGTDLRARAAIVATGTPSSVAQLLSSTPVEIAVGPPAVASCLELGLRRPPRHRFALGIDAPTYLSVHAPPARLAPDGAAVVHAVRYGEPGGRTDHDRVRRQLRALAALAGVDEDDVVVERFLPRMVVTGAIPVASSAGTLGRPSVDAAGVPGVWLAGDAVGAEGLLLDAACASATAAATAAMRHATTMVAR